jgi:hypothetical protein
MGDDSRPDRVPSSIPGIPQGHSGVSDRGGPGRARLRSSSDLPSRLAPRLGFTLKKPQFPQIAERTPSRVDKPAGCRSIRGENGVEMARNRGRFCRKSTRNGAKWGRKGANPGPSDLGRPAKNRRSLTKRRLAATPANDTTHGRLNYGPADGLAPGPCRPGRLVSGGRGNWLCFVNHLGFVFPASVSRPGDDRSPFESKSSAELASFRNGGEWPGSGVARAPGRPRVGGRGSSHHRRTGIDP